MGKKVLKRIYNMSDARLFTECRDKISSARRDILEFEKRNYKEATHFTPLEVQASAFSDLPTDLEFDGFKQVATEEKLKIEKMLKEKIRKIRTVAQNIFGEYTARYARFGFKGLDEKTDTELFRCGNRVAKTATFFLTRLSEEGVTAAQIADLKSTSISFEDAIENQLDAINDREIATEERTEAGNALYLKLVKLCNTGKDIWASTSEAKYNDYLIY